MTNIWKLPLDDGVNQFQVHVPASILGITEESGKVVANVLLTPDSENLGHIELISVHADMELPNEFLQEEKFLYIGYANGRYVFMNNQYVEEQNNGNNGELTLG